MDGGGCGALLGAEQLLFHELWVAARPRLSAAQVAAGRDQSVYPAQAEEKVFGANLAAALQGRSLGAGLRWLTAEQRAAACGLAAEVWGRGAESLSLEQRRLAEARRRAAVSEPLSTAEHH